jgi:hypothetical protein
MRTDNIAPRVVEVEPKSKQSKNLSLRSIAFLAVGFSFVAGMTVQQGIQRFLRGNSNYEWVSNLLLGLAYLVFSVSWVVRLSSKPRVPTSSSASTSR